MTTVAFDVDGCLISETSDQALECVRSMLVELKQLGCYIIVWSGGGEEYAAMQGRRIHIDQWVDEYSAKGVGYPDITFDDEEVTLGKVNIRIL